MKKIILSVFVIASLAILSCKNETKTEVKTEVETTTEEGKELSMANFGVRGNCGMCKTTIEKAANSVAGVADAIWDVEKKSIAISYDEAKANEKDIHKAIAAAGYDTDQVSGDEAAYKELPKCCQYTSDMEMSQ